MCGNISYESERGDPTPSDLFGWKTDGSGSGN